MVRVTLSGGEFSKELSKAFRTLKSPFVGKEAQSEKAHVVHVIVI